MRLEPDDAKVSSPVLRGGVKLDNNSPTPDDLYQAGGDTNTLPDYGSKGKAEKLAPLVRGWRNYHKFCKMNGTRNSLYFIQKRTYKVFNKEAKNNRHSSKTLLNEAFPAVPYSENKHVNVQGTKSPFDGDITYWSERNSKLYDGATSKALKKQNHACGYCGMKMLPGETVHLHHVDGNHQNWKAKNLLATHESCHDYIHMSKGKP
ncbi:hypothetical protein DP117_34645 [Brasilonema sp. UFV-L1]|nr:hypothetical protein [Brasilonema sp. UFV-L1]